MSDHALPAASIAAIAKLQERAQTKIITVEGVPYATNTLIAMRKPEPEPGTIVVHTLDALVTYLTDDVDTGYVGEHPFFIHVVSPTRVEIVTDVFGEFNQRVVVFAADAYVPDLRFGVYVETETFTIRLQSLFLDLGDRAAVLACAGNVTAAASRTVEDDGVTQQVTARSGISRVANVIVPNPVSLQPYRSFREINQPESEFIFRMKGGDEHSPPTCALFEADGGLWKLTAVRRIREYLEAKVSGFSILA